MSWQELVTAIVGALITGGPLAAALIRLRSQYVKELRALDKQRRDLDAQRQREHAAEIARLEQLLLSARRKSEPPPDPERRAAARAAGFPIGDTGRFELSEEVLGPMRCDAHKEVVRKGVAVAEAADTAQRAAEAALRMAQGLEAAVSAAAAAASTASASATRIEETVRRESEQTRDAVTELVESLGNIREWKGGVDAHREHVDGQVRALWAEARELRARTA
jgi:hypothetical protein